MKVEFEIDDRLYEILNQVSGGEFAKFAAYLFSQCAILLITRPEDVIAEAEAMETDSPLVSGIIENFSAKMAREDEGPGRMETWEPPL